MHPFFKGLIVGLLVGAAVGLFVTPRSGVENREFVRRRLQYAQEVGRRAARQQDERLRSRFRQAIGRREEQETIAS